MAMTIDEFFKAIKFTHVVVDAVAQVGSKEAKLAAAAGRYGDAAAMAHRSGGGRGGHGGHGSHSHDVREHLGMEGGLLNEMIKRVIDRDGDGLVDFEEFVTFDRLLNRPGQRSMAEIAFRLADVRKNNSLDADDFRQLWVEFSPKGGGARRLMDKLNSKLSQINDKSGGLGGVLGGGGGGGGGGGVGGGGGGGVGGGVGAPPALAMAHFEIREQVPDGAGGFTAGAVVGTRSVGLEEFVDMVEVEGALPDMLRGQIDHLVSHWQGAVLEEPTEAMRSIDGDDDTGIVNLRPGAGGLPVPVTVAVTAISAAVSRTAVAPFDRLKIMCQALGPRSPHDGGWWGYRGLYTMYRTEGLRSLWQGNTAYLARVVPQVVIQLVAFTELRKALQSFNRPAHAAGDADFSGDFSAPLSTIQSLLCAGTAGCLAQSVVYPLDVARARLAVVSPPGVNAQLGKCPTQQPTPKHALHWYRAKMPTPTGRELKAAVPDSMRLQRCAWTAADGLRGGRPTVTAMMGDIWKEQGVRGLYRGYPTMVAGAFLFTAFNWGIASSLMPLMPKKNDGSGDPTMMWAMTASLQASRISQLLTYPLDTVKRSMQASPLAASGMVGEARRLYREEGRGAFFRGVMLNLYKIGPSVTITYFCHSALTGLWETHMEKG